MAKVKSTIFQIIKRKETLLILVFFVAGLSLCGWLFDNISLASFSLKYKPISPIIALTFSALSILLLININFKKSRLTKLTVIFIFILVALFYSIIILGYFFNFTNSIENAFVKNANKFGGALTGYMSPFAALLFFLICISFLLLRQNYSDKIKHIGGSLTLLAFLISSVLLIAYLYKAPLLFGNQVIPVALPATLCFLLFSTTLLRIYELKFWTFNLIKDNIIAFRLLKSFLPIIVFAVIVQGLLITNLSIKGNNPTLSVALVLLIVVSLIVFIVIKASMDLGKKFLGAEQAVRESEERFSRAIRYAPFPIMIHAENGKVLAISRGWTDSSGYTLNDIPTIENWTEHAYGSRKQNVKEEINALYKMKGSKNEGEYIINCKDNTQRTWDFSSASLGNFDSEGRLVISMAIDITERKQAEDALQKSAENFQSIFENNSAAICIIEPDTIISMVNSEYCKLSGYTAEEVIGMSWTQQIPHEDLVRLTEFNRRRLLDPSGAPNKYEFTFYRKNGEIRYALMSVAMLQNKRIVASFSDITERKQAENALKANERILHQLNVDKDRFISILGHDLKSPFNNILGLSEVLIEDILKLNMAEIEEIANHINKSARITNKLLEDILMWARTQQGSIPFKPQNLSLSATCRNILEILNPSAYAKNITIYDSSADHIYVYADSDMLKTILLNLVSNAIKFTNSGGKITINAEHNSENATISVSDNGIGISSIDLTKLFDISEVLTTKGTAEETGTGLGLLICKEFVEKHQGKIWVESEEGRGSDFKFTLPVSVEQANAM
jgi:PAS domain S-box-containing protein